MITDSCEIYVHVPFCGKKCSYCDFFSEVRGRGPQRAYFEELKAEIRELRIPDFPGADRISSVFFGGGTPSVVEPERLGEVLSLLRSRFEILPGAEMTLEANPGTLTREKLRAYREMGFNRLSMGLQSTDNALLKKIGRFHTFEQFRENFLIAREEGFGNLSADLLSAVPGQTREGFEEGLAELLMLRPEHISVYSLIIEEGTPFFELYGPGAPFEKELPGDEEDRLLVHRTGEILRTAGYRQYEISNFSLPGFESRHNIGYWTGVPYYGFGAAAASLLPTGSDTAVRRKNAEALDYRGLPFAEEEILSGEDLQSEYMILGLRMNRGVSETEFRERFGKGFPEAWCEIIRKYEGLGALKTEGERVFFTEYGRDVSNLVMEDFL